MAKKAKKEETSMSTENAVAVKEQAGALATLNLNEFSADVAVTANDFLIPKLLIMQAQSELVTARKAIFGDICDSISGEKKGTIDKAIEIIPFFVQKKWDIEEIKADGKKEWLRSVPMQDNASLPDYNGNWAWEGTEDGKKIRRIYRYDFFVLLPEDIAKGSPMPYVLSFKSSSVKAGKILMNEMYVRNVAAKLLPFANKFLLSGEMAKNEETGGSYVVAKTTKGESCSEAQLQACVEWFRRIKSTTVIVDESDVTKSGTHSEPQDVTPAAASNGTGEF